MMLYAKMHKQTSLIIETILNLAMNAVKREKTDDLHQLLTIYFRCTYFRINHLYDSVRFLSKQPPTHTKIFT